MAEQLVNIVPRKPIKLKVISIRAADALFTVFIGAVVSAIVLTACRSSEEIILAGSTLWLLAFWIKSRNRIFGSIRVSQRIYQSFLGDAMT